jgi:hypothetical protein
MKTTLNFKCSIKTLDFKDTIKVKNRAKFALAKIGASDDFKALLNSRATTGLAAAVVEGAV